MARRLVGIVVVADKKRSNRHHHCNARRMGSAPLRHTQELPGGQGCQNGCAKSNHPPRPQEHHYQDERNQNQGCEDAFHSKGEDTLPGADAGRSARALA